MSKAERASTALTSTARDRLTNVPIMMIVGVLDPTNMENTTTTTATTAIMTTSITVVMIMTSTRTTRVDTRVTIVEVEVVVSLQREISVRLNVSSVRRWGIMQ